MQEGDTDGDQRELTDTAFQVVTWLQQWHFSGPLGHVQDLAMVNEEAYEDVVPSYFFAEIVLEFAKKFCLHMPPVWVLLLQQGCCRSTRERGENDCTPTKSTRSD